MTMQNSDQIADQRQQISACPTFILPMVYVKVQPTKATSAANSTHKRDALKGCILKESILSILLGDKAIEEKMKAGGAAGIKKSEKWQRQCEGESTGNYDVAPANGGVHVAWLEKTDEFFT
jgi:hypothetical protein